jgi:hypothetical protein
MRRSGIRKETPMTERSTSLAVWDIPTPAVAGERFAIKAGAKSAAGRTLAGACIEVVDANGAVVASGTLGADPWPGTEALCWTAFDVPAPAQQGVAEYAVRLAAGQGGESAKARFSVAIAAKPEYTLRIQIAERSSGEALAGVEVRAGPFRGRTDKAGRADLRIAKGTYEIMLWRTAHVAEPRPLTVDGDATLALTMTHVPEEHPDARWVR